MCVVSRDSLLKESANEDISDNEISLLPSLPDNTPDFQANQSASQLNVNNHSAHRMSLPHISSTKNLKQDAETTLNLDACDNIEKL
mmetsp:Transcript_15736/g.21287  ORF Transcript_15736/g.21287 Transcript_15736/m.21287 type:complete len:86 (+) Transcript_15736:127-384(+)